MRVEAEDVLIAEALEVTLGNIGSLKTSAGPGVITYDIWERGVSVALAIAKSRLPKLEPVPDLEGHPELFDT